MDPKVKKYYKDQVQNAKNICLANNIDPITPAGATWGVGVLNLTTRHVFYLKGLVPPEAKDVPFDKAE